MKNVLDLIIIGAGPAGIAAAIYASRAKLSFVILEKAFTGGQIVNTYEIENYPGIKATSGFELSNMFREHAETLEVEFLSEEVSEVITEGPIKKVITNDGSYEARTIIMATGASWKKLGAKGEDKFSGMGVSYCATCDGAFYRDKVTAVVGGGDVAVEDAIYLSRLCKKVYLIHRRDELRAVKVLQEHLFKIENIEIIWDSEVDEIIGEETVEKIHVSNRLTDEKQLIEVSGVFIAVGSDPNSGLVINQVETDQKGWIKTNEDCATSVPGVFAAGDLRVKSLRQVITAASDGAISVYAAERYLVTNG
ncbi:thioredoxin-disulfide reductase [Petrocella sp. FN5]|uniref:thioredoxin-disulfide reductase n=1 Tax=Petrocella sp. FN5 TaxID=3032002 RepID=UPI0023D9DFE7|nr:thioredoxin-disulfide reductase [Petrocella sp. FN5]MDF1617707.1 thioredoxin-disulfide reductase [Petrocella sp. FN5]